MPIVFSEHALDQINERNLSQEDVKSIIKDSKQLISSFRGRKLRTGIINGKLVEVITKTDGNKITVITAYNLED